MSAEARSLTKLEPALWIAQGLYLLVEVFVAARFAAEFSFVGNTISDLGATQCTVVDYPHRPVEVCSPLHDLMNGSFVVCGAGLMLASLLVAFYAPNKTTWAKAGVGLLLVSGASSVATGLVSINVDLRLHAAVSTPVFIAQPLAVLLLARKYESVTGKRAAVMTQCLSSLSLLAGVALLSSNDLQLQAGLLERAALWPGLVWMACLGVAQILRNRSRTPLESP